MKTQNRTRTERAVPVLLSFLISALVVIYRLSFDKIRSNEIIRTLQEENEALKTNLSEIRAMLNKSSPTPSYPVFSSPHPAEANPEEPCLKCEPGSELHGGNCYKFSSSKSSWTDSRRSCTDLGSDLVKIDSREEQLFLERKLRDMMEKDGDMFWIGLSDSDNDGGWFWVDGSPMNTSLNLLRNGEPRDESGEPAADSGGNGEQDGALDLKCSLDKSCDLLHRSVCEKAAAPGRMSPVCV
ncbi:CD209 antigen-like protein E [Poecilia formosa]|uniref:CD209 antigen-like protein E n=1 Tax=Poecilia formosa TaxID=48698 RepID=UPI0004441984|nr:PREDICTED: CD209 antigen-like protein E [Poecilia formosa]